MNIIVGIVIATTIGVATEVMPPHRVTPVGAAAATKCHLRTELMAAFELRTAPATAAEA
jgi:hypothetical protein